jgi:hypothetical protein
MKTSLAEKVFWTIVALSSLGAAWYGYQRFKLIRPDLYGTPQAVSVPEAERKQRIEEYQQKGDALTRAANPPPRRLKPGETCANGVVVTIARDGGNIEAKAVVENGVRVRCATH